MPERRTSRTACSSAGPMSGFEIGIMPVASVRPSADAMVAVNLVARPARRRSERRPTRRRERRRPPHPPGAARRHTPSRAGAPGCRPRARGPARRESRRPRRRRWRSARHRCRRRRPPRRRSTPRSEGGSGSRPSRRHGRASPLAVIERGNRSLVRIAFGPMKTPSSTVTPW